MKIEDRQQTEINNPRPARLSKRSLRIRNRVLMIVTAVLSLLLLVVLFLFTSGIAGGITPQLPSDIMVSLRRESAGWHALWDASETATSYRVELFSGKDAEGQAVYDEETDTAECMLPGDLPEQQPLTLRITPRRTYKMLGLSVRTVDGLPLQLTSSFRVPERYTPEWRVDPEKRTLTVCCSGGADDVYHLYLMKPDSMLEEVSQMEYSTLYEQERGYGEMVVRFGDDQDFPVPGENEEIAFLLRAERVEDHLRIWEDLNDTVTLRRNDLLTTDLVLEQEALDENRYRIRWSETAGRGYRVQKLDEETNVWETLAEYGPGDERVYETERLGASRYHSFRVVSLSYGNMASVQAELRVHTGITPLHATVWATKETKLTTDAAGKNVLCTIPAGTAMCVMEEEGDSFKVYSEYGEAYIGSDECMINLPEYLGDLCDYDITNSYSSIYLAHDYGLRGISGTVCVGYENVLLSDGSFLVPLLYPVAKRLGEAAQKTLQDGYRIKIYDSFRPYVTTRAIYDMTEAQLDNFAPAEPFSRVHLETFLAERTPHYMTEEMEALEEREPVEPEEGHEPGQPFTLVDEEGGTHYYFPDGTEYDPEMVADFTYRELMTKGGYGLNAFLAQSGSRHNYGVALDLTLERADTGEELKMQTAMHDLSYHSAQSANNELANMLKEYMFSVGFAGLSSEWWHFQDDEVYAALKPASVQNGVSVEGWKITDRGLRYRRADGSYLRDTSIGAGGNERHFDSAGFLIGE